MRRCGLIAAGLLLTMSAAADAQQGGVTSNRLMFDPAGLQNSSSRKLAPQPPSPAAEQTNSTSGHNGAPRQAATPTPVKQTAAPPPAEPAVKPAAKPKPAARAVTRAPAPPAPARAASRPSERPAPTRPPAPPRAAEEADTTRSADRAVPREPTPALGRLALPEGSVGFERRTLLKDYDMSDGSKVPGFENIQRNDSSYFGLSLRMPTWSSSSSPSSPSPPPPSSAVSPFRDHRPY